MAICQHSSVSVASAGRSTSRSGMVRSEDRCSTGWCVGPVLAEADRIVGHHVDDALLHQRREPDRRPRIVGKGEEGAAIGEHAAMQRDAVHRRRHRVLAHAVAHVAAGRGRLAVSGSVCEVLVKLDDGQVGRTAERPRQHAVDDLERVLRRLAGGELGLVGRKLLLQPVDRAGIAGRQLGIVCRRSNSARLSGLGGVEPLLPGRHAPARRDRRPCARHR